MKFFNRKKKIAKADGIVTLKERSTLLKEAKKLNKMIYKLYEITDKEKEIIEKSS